MHKTVSEKMRIKPGMRSILIDVPPDALNDMQLPGINTVQKLAGLFDYIHLFVKTQEAFLKNFPRLKAHLNPGGMCWVSWPKNKQQDTDLSLTKIIKMGYDAGLVESTTLSINSTWSAIKFTHPKEGKIYNNSYGKLKQ